MARFRWGFGGKAALLLTGVESFSHRRAVLRAIATSIRLDDAGEPRPAALLRGSARNCLRCALALAVGRLLRQRPIQAVAALVCAAILAGTGAHTLLLRLGVL